MLQTMRECRRATWNVSVTTERAQNIARSPVAIIKASRDVDHHSRRANRTPFDESGRCESRVRRRASAKAGTRRHHEGISSVIAGTLCRRFLLPVCDCDACGEDCAARQSLIASLRFAVDSRGERSIVVLAFDRRSDSDGRLLLARGTVGFAGVVCRGAPFASLRLCARALSGFRCGLSSRRSSDFVVSRAARDRHRHHVPRVRTASTGRPRPGARTKPTAVGLAFRKGALFESQDDAVKLVERVVLTGATASARRALGMKAVASPWPRPLCDHAAARDASSTAFLFG